jgi:hypothetical protein
MQTHTKLYDGTAKQTVKTLVNSMSNMGTRCVGLAQKIMQHIMPTINSIKEKREGVRRACYFKCNGKLKKQYEDMSLAEAFDIPNEIRLTVCLQGERKCNIAIRIFSDMYLYDMDNVEEFDRLVFDRLEACILGNITRDVFRHYMTDIVDEKIFSVFFD